MAKVIELSLEENNELLYVNLKMQQVQTHKPGTKPPPASLEIDCMFGGVASGGSSLEGKNKTLLKVRGPDPVFVPTTL